MHIMYSMDSIHISYIPFQKTTILSMILIPNWLIGISLTLLSTAIGSLGKVLIRCVHLIQSSSAYPAFLKARLYRIPTIASCLLK